MRRSRMSRRGSARNFRRGTYTHKRNFSYVLRGGIRL